MGNEVTPGPQRALSESTPLKLPVERFVVLIGAVVALTFAAAMWMANVDRNVATVLDRQERQDRRLERIEDALGVRANASNGAGNASRLQ